MPPTHQLHMARGVQVHVVYIAGTEVHSIAALCLGLWVLGVLGLVKVGQAYSANDTCLALRVLGTGRNPANSLQGYDIMDEGQVTNSI